MNKKIVSESLNEGVWNIPDKSDKIYIYELEEFQEKTLPLFGDDDEIQNRLNAAILRMKELLNLKSKLVKESQKFRRGDKNIYKNIDIGIFRNPKRYIEELEEFQKKIFDIFGDDGVHDELDGAIREMKKFIEK